MTYLLGFLMVSNVPFNSFKEIDWFQQMPFRTLVLATLLFSVIAAQPAIMLFTMALVYVSSGPLGYALKVFQNPKQTVSEEGIEHGLFSTKNGTK